MIGTKWLKDPIYGYLEIDEKLFSSIIDTACFQRLRSIRQTSYAPLYSAALHNRFIHSLGVYHLGTIAFEAISKVTPSGMEDVTFRALCGKYGDIFKLACLLHDIGHAPFSHSGEIFYLFPDEDVIYQRLINDVKDLEFSHDFDYYRTKPAAAHEIMSALIGLEQFSSYFESEELKSFFARCITGYQYQSCDGNDEKAFQNCLISLLNSSLIDVDRLDYLIRDSAVAGYDNVTIDYQRLLQNEVIIRDEKTHKLKIAFCKAAISVIEDVIYAHDSERKWIQNHPIVLYEHFLVQCGIRSVNSYFAKNGDPSPFCADALTEKGIDFKSVGHLSLLCDDDIVYLIKNVCPTCLTKEYYSRLLRRHPLWKSEAEYRALFDSVLGPISLEKLEVYSSKLEKYLTLSNGEAIINQLILDKNYDELRRASSTALGADKENTINGYEQRIKFMECLKDFSIEAKIDFDFVLICANEFKSGFMKSDLKKLPIYFSNFGDTLDFSSVVTPLDSSQNRDEFFYLYYRRNTNPLDVKKLVQHFQRELLFQ